MVETVRFFDALERVGNLAVLQDAIVAQGVTCMQNLLIMFLKEQIARMCNNLQDKNANPIKISMRQK
jgi:hypothetical protein